MTRMKVGIGDRFGRLVVLERVPSKRRDHRWKCRCDCGNEHELYTFSLLSSGVQSCGCLGKEQLERRTKHGMSSRTEEVPEYSVWENIIQRCTNSKAPNFKNYGAKGVTVCQSWRDFASFYADMGPRPSRKHTIDRIDNAKGYEPSNCRWATRIEQNNHTSRNVHVTYDGRTQTVAQWARELGVAYHTLRNRLNLGWDFKRAVTQPVDARYSRKGASQ